MSPSNPITNILTIDLEDYFQVSAFESVVKREDWDKYESRIERNTHLLLEILNEPIATRHSALHAPQPGALHSTLDTPYSPKATFFCLGWIAERYPNLIREIHQQGHEIACHGYAHKLVYSQTIEQFTEDIRKAKAILEDITGEEVVGYRAPTYSITKKSEWAFKVLIEEGFNYDSSIFPIHHDRYGIPNAPRFPFVISKNGNNAFEFSLLNFDLAHTHSSVNSMYLTNPSNPSNLYSLFEFPISTVRWLGLNFPMSGGGYFRILPYPLVKACLQNINEKENRPFIFYLHPWEMDPEQPRIQNRSLKSDFRHYVNLNRTAGKFRKLLGDFLFSGIRETLGSN